MPGRDAGRAAQPGRETRALLLIAVLALCLAPLLAGCGVGVQQTCNARGLEEGTAEFDSCVEQERAAAYARLQQRRYRPGGGGGA